MRRGGAGRPPHPPPWEEQISPRKFTLADFAGSSIREAGELIRHEPREHAVIYTPGGRALFYAASRAETPYRVTVPLWKAGLIRGNVFVHNHPGSESFSAEDIWILLRHGAREVHACGPSRSFRMCASLRTRRIGIADQFSRWQELQSQYQRALNASAPLFDHLKVQGILGAKEAWSAQTHGVVRELADRYRFAYTEI